MSNICPQNLLFWVIKRKVLGFDAGNFTWSWRPTRFTISCWFQPFKDHNLQNFWSKNGQKWKIMILYHFTKILMTLSQHEPGGRNLVSLCKIGIQKDLCTRFLNFWVNTLFLKILPFFDIFCQNGQNFLENCQIFKNSQNFKNLVHISFCTPVLHNLTKFQPPSLCCDKLLKFWWNGRKS